MGRNMWVVSLCVGLLGIATPAFAERRTDANQYVLQAVEFLSSKWGGQGYEKGAYYTHDLPYGSDTVKASAKKPHTMCVGAVAEVIIVAIDLYAKAKNDKSVFTAVPAISWTRTTRKDIRPYIFMFSTVKSNGTADALQQFGMGEQIPFEELRPGDFIGLNRSNGSGHAVVFIEYIDKQGNKVDPYKADVVAGFKYFSSQGKGEGSGLAYRWAYFGKICPPKDAARPRDCGVVRSSKQSVLNTGYMLDPTLWTVTEANDLRRAEETKRISTELFTAKTKLYDLTPAQRLTLNQKVRELFDTEMPESATRVDKYNGVTTD